LFKFLSKYELLRLNFCAHLSGLALFKISLPLRSFLYIFQLEKISKEPNKKYKIAGWKIPVKIAPTIAPIVVAISKNIATRKFKTSSFKNAIVEPELVAITAIMLAPIAYLISKPKAKVMIGVIIIPPPIPRMAPIIPANKPTASINNVDVIINKFSLRLIT